MVCSQSELARREHIVRGYTHYREITCLSQSPSIHKDRRKAIEILRSADSPILGAVTDIRFGELQAGWEVARIAREIDSDIPIVYISGHGAVDWPKRGVPDKHYDRKP